MRVVTYIWGAELAPWSFGMAVKTVRVYEVLYDTDIDGSDCDGTDNLRFRTEDEANRFAARNAYYGRPAKVTVIDVPRHIAQR